MSIAQKGALDMLMYYDCGPGEFNGLFNILNNKPLKTYYVYKAFSEFKEIGGAVYSEDDEDVFTIAASNGDEKAVLVSRFNDEDDTPSKKVELELNNMTDGDAVKVDYYLLDETHNLELLRSEYFTSSKAVAHFDMDNQSVYLLKIKKA